MIDATDAANAVNEYPEKRELPRVECDQPRRRQTGSTFHRIVCTGTSNHLRKNTNWTTIPSDKRPDGWSDTAYLCCSNVPPALRRTMATLSATGKVSHLGKVCLALFVGNRVALWMCLPDLSLNCAARFGVANKGYSTSVATVSMPGLERN